MRSYPEGNRNAIELRCCIAALIGCYQRYSYWGLPKDWQIMINNSTIGAMDGRRTPVAAWNPLGRTFEAFSSSIDGTIHGAAAVLFPSLLSELRQKIYGTGLLHLCLHCQLPH